MVPHELLAEREGPGDVSLDVPFDDLLEVALEGDVPLRIVALTVVRRHPPARAHVAQAREPLPHLGRHGRANRARVSGAQAAEEGPHLLEWGGPQGDEVLLLPRVGGEVVELGEGGVEVLEAVPQHAVDRRPAARERGRQGLEVARGRLARLDPRGDPDQAATGKALGHGQVEGVQDRRHEVDVTRARGDDPGGEQPGVVEDEGHPQRRLVGEDAVGRLAVVAQALAVVRGEHDQGVAPLSPGEERIEQGSEGRVGGGHLAVVGRGHAPAPVEGRLVGRVGLVEVHPAQLRPRRRLEPRTGRGHGLRARTLLHLEVGARRRVAEAVVVDLEAAVEAEPGVEGEGAHEGAGAIALAPEQRGQRLHARRETEA